MDEEEGARIAFLPPEKLEMNGNHVKPGGPGDSNSNDEDVKSRSDGSPTTDGGSVLRHEKDDADDSGIVTIDDKAAHQPQHHHRHHRHEMASNNNE